jgi:polar amino acid transport system substrate-binding protein
MSALKKESIIGFFLLCLLSVFSPVTAADSHLSAVKSNGVLYFGTSSDYVPFTFYGADGTITGLDIQLAEEIANRIGVSLRVIDLAYDGLIDSVRVGQVDLIGGALSKSIENAQLVDFSRVYFMGTGRIVALKSKEIPADITLSFLSDKSIGVRRNQFRTMGAGKSCDGGSCCRTIPCPLFNDCGCGKRFGSRGSGFCFDGPEYIQSVL